MRLRLLLGLVPLVPPAALSGACVGAPVDIGVVMLAPQGLLDQASSVTLSVFDASAAKCNKDTGHVSKIPPAEEGTKTFQLAKKGCEQGVAWCKTVELDEDGSKKMFAVVAKNAGGLLAEGCTTAVIDQDPLEVTLKVHRYNEPACCNDGRVQVGEQCDSAIVDPACQGDACACTAIAIDAVCDYDCTTFEILLSSDNPTPKPDLHNGPPGTKTDLQIAFGPGGANTPNMLRAVFANSDGAEAMGGIDVQERFLAQDLYPIVSPVPLSLQLGLPLKCGATTTSGLPRKQRAPAIAPASIDTVAVVYESDEAVGGKFDVYLAPQTADGCTDTKNCTEDTDCQTAKCTAGKCVAAVKVSGSQSGSALAPHVAGGPANSVLIVWTRTDGVYGRIWKTNGTMIPPTSELLIAKKGQAARVAGDANGWKVVFAGGALDDADAILLATVDENGAVKPPIRVNAFGDGLQDQPDVAMLTGGKTIVVWHNLGDIYFQRYDEQGNAVAGDQDAPLNTTGVFGSNSATDEQHPAVAASIGFGEFYAVAWETIETANIAARFVDGTSGFGYNNVSGQNDEFVATSWWIPGQRHKPAVAIGGAGFVAIGWEDVSVEHPGVYVRRFPLPSL